MTEETNKSKILSRVRALLAKADSSGFDEEADAFRAKADELMTLYAIESFELAQKLDPNKRESPEVRNFEFGADEDLSTTLYTSFYYLADLTRCKMGVLYHQSAKVVGYSADLDYLDLLMTSVLTEIVRKMSPTVDRTKSYEENMYVIKAAGAKWQQVYELLLPAFPERFSKVLTDLTPEDYDDLPEYLGKTYIRLGDDFYPRKLPHSVGVRFTGEYKKHCEKFDLSRIMVSPSVYRRSFLTGFTTTLRERIHELKKAQQKATEGHGLVLASRDGDLNETLWENFPNLRPHDADCDCESCHYRRCKDSSCGRRLCREARKPVRYRRVPEKAFSSAASSAGSRAAKNVNLSGGRNNLKGTRELS